MRFEDEIYVRIYTRDTPDLLALGWEGRALLWEVLRKVDRAGLLPIGKSGHRGLAALLHMPEDVVGRAMPALLEDGVVVLSDGVLCVRNFIEAQETPQSDAARARDYRARKRDIARARALGVEVPDDPDEPPPHLPPLPRHEPSRGVTPSSRPVTPHHATSHDVTSRHAASHEDASRDGSVTNRDAIITPSSRPVTSRHDASRRVTARHSLLSFAMLKEEEEESARDARPTPPPTDTAATAAARPALMSEAGESLHRALQASRSFRALSGRVAQELAAQVDSGRIDLADALHVVTEADEREAIRQAADQDVCSPGSLAKYLRGCMRRAQRGDAKRATMATGSQARRTEHATGQPVPMAKYEVPPDVAASLRVPEEVYARKHRELRAAQVARAGELRAAHLAARGKLPGGPPVRLADALPARLAGELSSPSPHHDQSAPQSEPIAPLQAQQSASASADSEIAS